VPGVLPPGLAPLPTWGDLFSALKQRWLLALTASLGSAAATAAILLYLLPSSYTASAWLKLDQPAAVAAAPRPGAQEGDGPAEPARSASAGLALLLQSPPLLARVLEQPEVAGLPEVSRQQDPRSWLDQRLQIQTDSPPVVRLTLATEQPQTGEVFLETLVAQFLEQMRQQKAQRLAQLRQQQQQLASQLPSKPVEVLPAPRETPPIPAIETAVLARAEQALQEARLDLMKSQTELTFLQNQAQAASQATVPATMVEEQLEKEIALKPLRQESARLQGLLDQIKRTSVLEEKDPSYRRYAAERGTIQKKVDQRRQEITHSLEKQVREKAQEESQVRVARAQEQVTVLREREHGLAEEVRKLKAQMAAHPAPARPVPEALSGNSGAPSKQEAPDGKEDALRQLGAEIHLLTLQGPEAVGVQRLGEVETGVTGETRRIGIATFSGLSVLLIVLGSVSWLEFQARRVRTPGGLARGLNVPVLGALPAVALPAALPPGPASNLKEVAHQNQLAEAADVIRTLILQRLAGSQAGPANQPLSGSGEAVGKGVVLVAGTHGQEGTTSTACQLALSMARGWRRTLLIDGHFRKPAIHECLQLSLEPGLSEVLRGEVELAEAVQPTKVSRLWFLPAGHWDPHALQSLAQDKVDLFHSLPDQYDVVIIDAGPLLPLADALLLAQQADAVILAALAGHSRLPWINDAWYRLNRLGVPLLGVVVNGAN